MLHTADDYAAAIRALLPTGRAWTTDTGTVRSRVIDALAKLPGRLDAAAAALLAGALPGSNKDLIPEWEATLGLPDPCVGLNPTLVDRGNQVRARFIGATGQSTDYFIAFAAALGFSISIQFFAAFRADVSTVKSALAEDEWYYAWGVEILANPGGLSPDVLLCELNSLKPAQTHVFLT